MNLFEEIDSSKKLLISKVKDGDGKWGYKYVELTVFADNPSSCANGATVKILLEFKLNYEPDHPDYTSFYINID